MIGSTISHYRILEKLGEGGMGVVYKAHDTKLDRDVALKFLSQILTTNTESIERFQIEAKSAAALNHPNIVTIYEIGEHEGQLFIAMEFIEGNTLREEINEHRISNDDIRSIVKQVCEGLGKAHEKGIIHRDIKPENILINSDGQVKILDFGLAKLKGAGNLTKDMSTLGTAKYLSPEQARGVKVDNRSDIWSVGVVLYEMLTGQLPFKGEYESAVIYSIVNEIQEPVTAVVNNVPIELEKIINKCLEKDPANRYANVGELNDDLQWRKNQSGTDGTSSKNDKQNKHSKSILISTAILSIILLFTVVYFLIFQGEKGPSGWDNSIAVLPFTDLSPDKDQEYLCDGMTDKILTNLTKLKVLKVIARTSVMQYKNTEKTIPVIGKELGVDNVMEGSIFKSGNRIRVTAQLINTKSGIHLWADDYERNLDDLFDIQDDISENIANNLLATLSPEEKKGLKTIPTTNMDAYHHFLKGRYYLGRPHFTSTTWQEGIDNLQKAVELDTNFALAFSELSKAHSRLIFLRYDLSEDRLEKAKNAADKALQLQENSPEVHLNIGYYHLWAHRDAGKALEEFTIAEKYGPNIVGVLKAKAQVYETRGMWSELINTLETAVELSPRDPSILTDLSSAYWFMRKYDIAMSTCNRAIEIAPEATWPYLYMAYINWCSTGPNENSSAALKNVSSGHSFWLWSWYWQEVGQGNYQKALDLLPKTDGKWMINKSFVRPKSMLSAFIHGFLNESHLAYAAYDSSRIFLEDQVKKYANDPRYHSSLGIAYAGVGRKEDAIREGKKAVDLLPISKDAFYGTFYASDLAIIYTMTGDHDLALDQVERLLSIPSFISKSWLKMDIRFAPLYDHPRFIELIEKYSGEN